MKSLKCEYLMSQAPPLHLQELYGKDNSFEPMSSIHSCYCCEDKMHG